MPDAVSILHVIIDKIEWLNIPMVYVCGKSFDLVVIMVLSLGRLMMTMFVGKRAVFRRIGFKVSNTIYIRIGNECRRAFHMQ